MRGEIRNKIRELSREDCLAILRESEHGVLATVDALARPATVAMNHVLLEDGCLYFHSGKEGEKIDNLRANPQASYFVTAQAEVVYEQFTTTFASVAVHGQIQFVEDPAEKLARLSALVERFSSEIIPEQAKQEFIKIGVENVEMLRLVPEHLTGKARSSRKRPCLAFDPDLDLDSARGSAR